MYNVQQIIKDHRLTFSSFVYLYDLRIHIYTGIKL